MFLPGIMTRTRSGQVRDRVKKYVLSGKPAARRWGKLRLLSVGVLVSCSGNKRKMHESDNSPPFRTEVKNELESYLRYPHAFMACRGTTLLPYFSRKNRPMRPQALELIWNTYVKITAWGRSCTPYKIHCFIFMALFSLVHIVFIFFCTFVMAIISISNKTDI
jgi:hypothetical protein